MNTFLMARKSADVAFLLLLSFGLSSAANGRAVSFSSNPQEGEDVYCALGPSGDWTLPIFKETPPPEHAHIETRYDGDIVVELEYCVDTNGHSSDVAVQTEDPIGLGGPAAFNYVHRWLFTPATFGGDPIKVCGCEAEVHIHLGE